MRRPMQFCGAIHTSFISANMGLVSGKKFSLIGTPEGDEFKDPSRSFCYSHLATVPLASVCRIGISSGRD